MQEEVRDQHRDERFLKDTAWLEPDRSAFALPPSQGCIDDHYPAVDEQRCQVPHEAREQDHKERGMEVRGAREGQAHQQDAGENQPDAEDVH